eukprot:5711751-Ditylum_brightwellii.AAC.1
MDESVDIKATKTCPSCGGTDHQRNSSRLCKAQKKIPTPSEGGISQQQKKIGSKSKEGRSSVKPTTFQLTFDTEYGGKETREPTAMHLMSKYFPFYIIDKFVRTGNKYCLQKKD